MTVTKIGKRLDFWGWSTRAAAVQERLGYKGRHKTIVRDVPWLRLGRKRSGR